VSKAAYIRYLVEMTFQRKLNEDELSLLRKKVSAYCGELIGMGNHLTFLAVFRNPEEQRSFIDYVLGNAYLAKAGKLHLCDHAAAKSRVNFLSIPLRDYKVYAGSKTFDHSPFDLPLGTRVQIVGSGDFAGDRGVVEDYFIACGSYFVRLDSSEGLRIFRRDQIDLLNFNLVADSCSGGVFPISEINNIARQEVLERLNELAKDPDVQTIEIARRKPRKNPQPLTFWQRLAGFFRYE
jgi:hypothetical protein